MKKEISYHLTFEYAQQYGFQDGNIHYESDLKEDGHIHHSVDCETAELQGLGLKKTVFLSPYTKEF